MADFSSANDMVSWAIGLPTVGSLVVFVLSVVRRRLSADTKVVKGDKSYVDMLESYKNERDSIKEEKDRVLARMVIVEQERNEAISKVGKLTAEVGFLSQQVTDLKALVEKLSVSLDAARTDMNKYAIDNARLAAHVSYLTDIVDIKDVVALPAATQVTPSEPPTPGDVTEEK